MFNRRVALLFIVLSLGIALFYGLWQSPAGPALVSGEGLVSAERMRLDLSGEWEQFSSLRKAWIVETEKSAGKAVKPFFLEHQNRLVLPSATEFSIAARRFRIPSEWSARTMELKFSGVTGRAEVYLNGADSGHKIGEFEGLGGTSRIAVPPSAFYYGKDNIVLIQLAGSYRQREGLFGLDWPSLGSIRGRVGLEAVVETSIADPSVQVDWQGQEAAVTVRVPLIHHTLMGRGPWTVYGVLSDGSAGVAEDSSVVQPAESEADEVTLHLNVSNPRRWSPKDPSLYQLHLSVVNSAGDRDDLAFPIGLMALGMAQGQIQVNGEALPIRGQALSEAEEARIRQEGRVREFMSAEKKAGFNLLYFVGAFPDSLWLNEADQLGMGIWGEWPVDLVATPHLPGPQFFKPLASGGRHPSLWAFTVGKGLDPQSVSASYGTEAGKAVGGKLAFVLRFGQRSVPGFPPERSPLLETDKIQGPWGEVKAPASTDEPGSWPNLKGGFKHGNLFLTGVPAAGGKAGWLTGVWPQTVILWAWAALMLLITGGSLRSVSWRYKEIAEKKPKRRLREAWFWHGLAVLGRYGTLAGILITALFQAPVGFDPWLPKLWPGLELVQKQNPFLLWAILALTLLLLRLLQAGLIAPTLDASPHPLGLVLWLEQRYRWVILAAVLWALMPWGLSWLAALTAYIGLSLLFWPLRIRDIHRIGGRYRSFWLVPGMFILILIVWLVLKEQDLIYLWHLSH